MDSEELSRRINAIKISSRRKEEPIGIQKLETYLVGKVFSPKSVNQETLRTQMPRILQLKKPVKIEVVGKILSYLISQLR